MSTATAEQIRRLESLEKRIIKELKNVESLERKISGEEQEIEEQERKVSTSVQKLLHWRNEFVKNLSQQHRIFFNTLLTVGVILISRGVWEISDKLPLLSSSGVSLVVGVGILVIINRYPNPANLS